MGTYTTNYQLYMPSVGETGWGILVNGNFTTIDTAMKGLSNRITVVENEVNGALSCTSVTTSGKITGNGGIAGTTGTFSGAVSALNITKTGLFPATLMLTTSPSTMEGISTAITYSGSASGSIANNTYASINLLGISGQFNAYSSQSAKTIKSIYSGEYTINKIYVQSGTWTFKLAVGIYITGTLISSSGAKYSVTGSSNSEGILTLTQAQVLDILSGPVTYTYKCTHGNASQHCDAHIYIRAYNTSGTIGYMYIQPTVLF